MSEISPYTIIGFDKYYYHKHKEYREMTAPTINQAIEKYLESVKLARSLNTSRTYANAMNALLDVLRENELDPEVSPVSDLTEDVIAWMANALKDFSPATEQLYLAATTGFFKFWLRKDYPRSTCLGWICYGCSEPGVLVSACPNFHETI